MIHEYGKVHVKGIPIAHDTDSNNYALVKEIVGDKAHLIRVPGEHGGKPWMVNLDDLEEIED